MTLLAALATFSGAFIFPVLLRLMWDPLVEKLGVWGGWMAAAFIVGTMWTLNHGVNLIFQSGDAWIDQGFAAGIGLLVASYLAGGKIDSSVWRSLATTVVGGAIGGFLLSIIL